LVVVINYANHQSQCRITIDQSTERVGRWRVIDLFSETPSEQTADDLNTQGLYCDLSPWQAAVFRCAWNDD
jgi:hypothetical protein